MGLELEGGLPMCGIAGIWGDAGPEAGARLRAMLAAMGHRGPDGVGVRRLAGGWLGHVRLAIVDLATGDQPLPDGSGRTWAVVNGEIYNHRRLRRTLGEGRFRTQSDSEAALVQVEEEGAAGLWRLDGMFAIALAGQERLILGRDPLGIKPLYVGRDRRGNLLFASEMKALLPFAETVEELPPGTWMDSDGNRGHHSDLPAGGRERSWSPRQWTVDPERAVRMVSALLERTVAKRLMADVPVGVFLSGGLDSSLVAALAVKAAGRRLKSFAIGLPGSADLEYARQVADHLGTDHHERVVDPGEIPRLLPRVVYHLESYDPSLVRSAVVTYLVSELASRHVKVVLSGEGADELFAGYQYLSRFRDPLRLQAELLTITAGLHNTNLQRVDRMTMAHGLEGRVPFLDAALVRYALSIDPRLKLHLPGRPEKWLLRRVAEPYLPASVVWRKKEKFAVGSGAAQVLQDYAARLVSDRRLAGGLSRTEARLGEGRAADAEDTPETKEEWLYRRLFRRYFRHPAAASLVGHSRSLNPDQLTRWARGEIA